MLLCTSQSADNIIGDKCIRKHHRNMLDWILYLVTAVALYYWTTKSPKGYPPGPPNKPIIGSFPSLKGTQLHFLMEDMREKYGPVVGLKAFTTNVVMVCGPKEVQEALKNERLQGRPNFDRNRNNPRRGIIFVDADEFWRDQRRFALRHLRDFGFGKTSTEDMILREADELTTLLSQKTTVQINGLFAVSSVNILWAMMGGSRFPHGDPVLMELLESIDKAFRTPPKSFRIIKSFTIVQKLFPKWAGVTEGDDLELNLRAFIQKAVIDHKRTKGEAPRDFIDAYLKELEKLNHKSSFTEETMLAVCMDLFVGGAETVSNSLGFCILYLVLYPEWQEKLFQEIDSVLGERRPRMEHRKRLPLVEAFVSEGFRSNPVAPSTVPRRCMQDTHLGGYFIPKDTLLFVSQWSGLQDEQHWGDPKNFRPERFLDDDGRYRKDDWLINFGAGKRLCIGEQFSKDFLFLLLVDLIQKFRIRIPEGHPKPSTLCLAGSTVSPQPFEAEFIARM